MVAQQRRQATVGQATQRLQRLLHRLGRVLAADRQKAGQRVEERKQQAQEKLIHVKGAIPIYPGIDIDVPTGLDEKRTLPSDVRAATLAALKAGAPGVVLSRKYAEMKLTNIAGAKQALRDAGAAQ